MAPKTDLGKFRKLTSDDGRKNPETDTMREAEEAIEECSEDYAEDY